ncbi:MAG: DUF4276 family protein [Chitinispirillales bacterium]|jgi:hypothetical protein|nr:DUF4276 family protein [Chitinispirillales bacterium]
MSNRIEVMVIVEGKTEVFFINRLLAPYLAAKNIFLTPTQISGRSENKGGNVRFARTQKD